MSLVKNKEIRNFSLIEINHKITEVRKNIFELKFKQATRQTIQPHLFKAYRRMLAQLLTIKHELK